MARKVKVSAVTKLTVALIMLVIAASSVAAFYATRPAEIRTERVVETTIQEKPAKFLPKQGEFLTHRVEIKDRLGQPVTQL